MANAQSTSNSQKPDPFDIILFGATGDLAQRKLMRAMYRRVVADRFRPARRSSHSPART